MYFKHNIFMKRVIFSLLLWALIGHIETNGASLSILEYSTQDPDGNNFLLDGRGATMFCSFDGESVLTAIIYRGASALQIITYAGANTVQELEDLVGRVSATDNNTGIYVTYNELSTSLDAMEYSCVVTNFASVVSTGTLNLTESILKDITEDQIGTLQFTFDQAIYSTSSTVTLSDLTERTELLVTLEISSFTVDSRTYPAPGLSATRETSDNPGVTTLLNCVSTLNAEKRFCNVSLPDIEVLLNGSNVKLSANGYLFGVDGPALSLTFQYMENVHSAGGCEGKLTCDAFSENNRISFCHGDLQYETRKRRALSSNTDLTIKIRKCNPLTTACSDVFEITDVSTTKVEDLNVPEPHKFNYYLTFYENGVVVNEQQYERRDQYCQTGLTEVNITCWVLVLISLFIVTVVGPKEHKKKWHIIKLVSFIIVAIVAVTVLIVTLVAYRKECAMWKWSLQVVALSIEVILIVVLGCLWEKDQHIHVTINNEPQPPDATFKWTKLPVNIKASVDPTKKGATPPTMDVKCNNLLFPSRYMEIKNGQRVFSWKIEKNVEHITEDLNVDMNKTVHLSFEAVVAPDVAPESISVKIEKATTE